jgi:hypothetical protein
MARACYRKVEVAAIAKGAAVAAGSGYRISRLCSAPPLQQVKDYRQREANGKESHPKQQREHEPFHKAG